MIKLLKYKNKIIAIKNESVFILNDNKLNIGERLTNKQFKGAKLVESVDAAKQSIDFDDADEYVLPTVVYQIIINPGESDEELREFVDINEAQELFDGLKVDPAENYHLIKFVKYDYDQDSEEILDFVDFNNELGFNESLTKSDDINQEVINYLATIVNTARDMYGKFNTSQNIEDIKDRANKLFTTVDLLKEILK